MRKEIAIWRREIQEECVWIQQRACESQEREARRRKEGLNIKNQNCSNDMRMVTDATAVAEVKAMWVASPQLPKQIYCSCRDNNKWNGGIWPSIHRQNHWILSASLTKYNGFYLILRRNKFETKWTQFSFLEYKLVQFYKLTQEVDNHAYETCNVLWDLMLICKESTGTKTHCCS